MVIHLLRNVCRADKTREADTAIGKYPVECALSISSGASPTVHHRPPSSSSSSSQQPIVVGDAMFGIMLFVLAYLQPSGTVVTLPFSHYIDLWSMDACIIYLILRTLAVGLYILCPPSSTAL
jgi:hypothetical protein